MIYIKVNALQAAFIRSCINAVLKAEKMNQLTEDQLQTVLQLVELMTNSCDVEEITDDIKSSANIVYENLN